MLLVIVRKTVFSLIKAHQRSSYIKISRSQSTWTTTRWSALKISLGEAILLNAHNAQPTDVHRVSKCTTCHDAYYCNDWKGKSFSENYISDARFPSVRLEHLRTLDLESEYFPPMECLLYNFKRYWYIVRKH